MYKGNLCICTYAVCIKIYDPYTVSQVDYQPEIKAKHFYTCTCQGYQLRARYLHAVRYFHYAGTLLTKLATCFGISVEVHILVAHKLRNYIVLLLLLLL